MKPLAAKTLAAKTAPPSFEKTRVTKPLSIIAMIVLACLILMILLFFSSGGKFNQVFACIVAGVTALNVLLSKRKNMTKHNLNLLVLTLVAAFVGTLLNAVSLSRPITYTDSFFKSAEVDFHRDQLAYSETGAMFGIRITTEEFEKLVNHYREEAHDRQHHEHRYGWLYFELEPGSIDRDTFFDSSDEMDGSPFTSHLQNIETTDSDIVSSYRLKSGIKSLMEGFPEIDDDLGPCRVIIWQSPEVTREFYWFEKQQRGYINP